MSRAGRTRAAVGALAALLGAVGPALAHDLVDAALVARYLGRVDALRAAAADGRPAEARAEATYDLGEAIHEVTGLLDRDLAAHGGELGLAATVLVRELRTRGIALAPWPEARRFHRYLAPFETYRALRPDGPRRDDALFRLVEGRFAEGFVLDPRRPARVDWSALQAEIRDAETLHAARLDPARRETVAFVLAVSLFRAAREAPDATARPAWAARAGAALAAFADAHPESLRAAAARALLESLPPAE